MQEIFFLNKLTYSNCVCMVAELDIGVSFWKRRRPNRFLDDQFMELTVEFLTFYVVKNSGRLYFKLYEARKNKEKNSMVFNLM